MTELHRIPNNSPLRIDGRDATFHHIDGMYSYCTFDDAGKGSPFHIVAWAEMEEIDGRWELSTETEDKE